MPETNSQKDLDLDLILSNNEEKATASNQGAEPGHFVEPDFLTGELRHIRWRLKEFYGCETPEKLPSEVLGKLVFFETLLFETI